MPDIKDVITFLESGLNYDDAYEFMPKGDSRYRQNIHVDESQVRGKLVKAMGCDYNRFNSGSPYPVVTVVHTYDDTYDYYTYSSLGTTGGTGITYQVTLVTDAESPYDHYDFRISFYNGKTSAAIDAEVKAVLKSFNNDYIYVDGSGGTTTTLVFAFLKGMGSPSGVMTQYLFSVPAGTNTVIGSCNWEEQESIIYFLHNSNNNHCIIQYNYNTFEFTYILGSKSVLAFDDDYPIVNPRVLGIGDDATLYWLNVNVPQQLNLIMAINYTASSGTPIYSSITAQTLAVIKYPPMYEITLAYGTDTDYVGNNIRGKTLQFAYQFKYIDNTFSCMSSISRMAIPRAEVFMETTDNRFAYGVADPYINNYLTLTIQNGTDLVEYLYLYMRGGNNDDWFLFDIIENDASPISYTFYNDKTPISQDQDYLARLFDYVPLLANCQEILSDNRLIYGGITEGYDSIAKDTLDLTGTINFVGRTYSDVNITVSYTLLGGSGDHQFDVDFTTDFSADYIFLVTVRTSSTTAEVYCSYVSGKECANADAMVDLFVTKIGLIDDAYINSVSNEGGDVLRIVLDASSPGYAVKAHRGATDQRLPTFNMGGIYQLGVIYCDDGGRCTSVNTNDDSVIKVPSWSDSGQAAYSSYANMLITIGHLPPTWATRYKLVVTKNLAYDYFINVRFADDTELYFDTNYWTAKINDALDTMYENTGIDYTYYTFAEGDKFRIFADGSGVILEDQYVEFEITGTNGIDEFYLSYDTPLLPFNIDNTAGVWVQVFRPKTTSDTLLFYETGLTDEIYESSGVYYHRGATQDQTAVQDATFYITGIDAYHGAAMLNTSNEAWIISQNFYLTKTSEECLIGRANTNIELFQEYCAGRVRYGGLYNEDQSVSYINKFDYDDYKDLDVKYGDLIQLRQFGYMLKCFQSIKVSSTMLERTMALDAGGNEQIILSSEVLGNIREYPQNYGCKHQLSVVKTDNYIYFFDAHNSIVVRDNGNALEVISDYKMKAYFSTLVSRVSSGETADYIVLCGYDRVFKTFYFTLRDPDESDNNVTLGFYEPTNRWISFYSFIPEFYGPADVKEMFTFKAALIFTHNLLSFGSNWGYYSEGVFVYPEIRSSYYGIIYDSELDIIGNEQAGLLKIFESLKVQSSYEWKAEDAGDVFVPTHNNYVAPFNVGLIGTSYEDGAYSLIFLTKKHGQWVGPFLRDATTTEDWKPLNLLNGRRLRGSIIVIRLTDNTDSFTKNEIFVVEVDSSKSS